VTGNSGPSVTAVSVINANMTARFTLHMNSGTELTASIAAGAITDQFGNSGTAFSGNYTVEGGFCGWSAGPDMPSVGVRLVGVFFPANGKFYEMGGRAFDGGGGEFTHPFEYDPATNTWTTKSATYPDNLVNNMACGVLTEAGTPYIYCVGGSESAGSTVTGRVFRYNPVTDTLSTVAAPWPSGNQNILPGGFSVFGNKLYILGGFNVNVGMDDKIWEFTPPSSWVQKSTILPAQLGYIPTATLGNLIYTGGGSLWDGSTLQDSNFSFVYDPIANTIGPIANIPRATGETRGLNLNGQMSVMGGGRVAPNPSNEVNVYDPGTNTWSTSVPPFTTARRNFPTDSDGTGRVWLAGGYDSTLAPVSSMEIFECTTGGDITLQAHVRRQGGNRFVVLNWSPADGGSVNVLRNGAVIGTTADDGNFQKNIHAHTGTDTYQVCETDSGDCSNVVIVRVQLSPDFNGPASNN